MAVVRGCSNEEYFLASAILTMDSCRVLKAMSFVTTTGSHLFERDNLLQFSIRLCFYLSRRELL